MNERIEYRTTVTKKKKKKKMNEKSYSCLSNKVRHIETENNESGANAD